MSPRHPVVLFDAGGTLLGPRRSYGTTYARVLETVGLRLAPADLDRALARTAAALSAEIAPGRDRFGHFPGGEAAYWLRLIHGTLATVTGERVDPALARRALDPLRDAFRDPAAWRVYDDVVPALDRLASQGFRLGIVSNWDSRLPALLDALGLAGRFEACAVSHLEGMEKPDPRLFERILARLGAHPDDALHVGDVPELDLAGARAAGVSAVLVDRAGDWPEFPDALPDLGAVAELARRGRDAIRPT